MDDAACKRDIMAVSTRWCNAMNTPGARGYESEECRVSALCIFCRGGYVLDAFLLHFFLLFWFKFRF